MTVELAHLPRPDLVALPEQSIYPLNPQFRLLASLESWPSKAFEKKVSSDSWIARLIFPSPSGKTEHWTRIRFNYPTQELSLSDKIRDRILRISPPYSVIKITASHPHDCEITHKCIVFINADEAILLGLNGSVQTIHHTYPNLPGNLRDHFLFDPGNRAKFKIHDWINIEAPMTT